MAMASVLGWAGVGIFTRAMQLGIAKEPLSKNFGPYGIAATLGGGLGYYLHTVDNRQHELLDLFKKRILANREREAAKKEARAEARAAAASEE